MELPPYRRPLLKSVLKNTWDKTKGFIVKAGTVILSLSVLIWILQNFHRHSNSQKIVQKVYLPL